MNIQSVNMMNKYNNFYHNTNSNSLVSTPDDSQSDTVSFKGKGDKKVGKVTEFFAKTYGKWFVNSKGMQNFSEWLAKLDCGNVTQHLATLGSFITSGVYIQKTLTNESLDDDRRKTLAWNQGLVLLVSTIGAYSLSNLMGDINKQLEYKYVAIQEQKMAKMGNVDAKKLEAMKEVFSNRLKGFRTLLPIATFTLVYRYISPVAITPIANRVSDKFTALDEKKQQKNEEKAMEIEMNNSKTEENKEKAITIDINNKTPEERKSYNNVA